MVECHSCPINAEILAGKHKETSFDQMPCATCPGSDMNRSGRMTQNRALRGRAGLSRLSLDYETKELVERHDLLNSQTIERLGERYDEIIRLAQCLFDVDMVTRDIILNRLVGEVTMKEHAAGLGISVQAAYARIKVARSKHPWIKEAISIRDYKEATDRIEVKRSVEYEGYN